MHGFTARREANLKSPECLAYDRPCRLHDAVIAENQKGSSNPWPVVVSSPTRKKLEEMYVKSSLPEYPKRSETEWTETVSRLSSKG